MTRSKSGSPWVPTASEVTECVTLSLFTTVMAPPRSAETVCGEKPLAAPPTGITIVVSSRSATGREAAACVSRTPSGSAAVTPTATAITVTMPNRMPSRPAPLNPTAEVCDRRPNERRHDRGGGVVV